MRSQYIGRFELKIIKSLAKILKNDVWFYQNTAVLKTAKYYRACLDTDSIQAKGAAPLKTLIANYGGWSLSGSPNTFTVATLLGKVMRELNVQALLGLGVSVDITDNTRHVVKVSWTLEQILIDFHIYAQFSA